MSIMEGKAFWTITPLLMGVLLLIDAFIILFNISAFSPGVSGNLAAFFSALSLIFGLMFIGRPFWQFIFSQRYTKKMK